MSDIAVAVRVEIEEIHRFFVRWFAGDANTIELDEFLLPRLDTDLVYVTPDGHRFGRDALVSMLRKGHGDNADFRIRVEDVRIRRELGDDLLATYTEWQRGARASSQAENARITTVLLTKRQPFRWLHIHETWLPEAERAAGSFDF
ncbi:MAG: DUF4440 domain-containing protein [Geminicoccaceae bacterium]